MPSVHWLASSGLLQERMSQALVVAFPNRFTGLSWAEFGVEEGCVECQLGVDYSKAKKQELPNEEETAAHAAAGSRHAELHQAIDGLTRIEGPLFKKRRDDTSLAAFL